MQILPTVNNYWDGEDHPFIYPHLAPFAATWPSRMVRMEMISGQMGPLPVFRNNLEEWIKETVRQLESHLGDIYQDLRQIYEQQD